MFMIRKSSAEAMSVSLSVCTVMQVTYRKKTYHEIKDGRFFFRIFMYNDKTGTMRKEIFTQVDKA